MALMDGSAWPGKIFPGGWTAGGGGNAAVTGLATNTDAFTVTHRVAVRGGITPYPF